MPNKIIRYLERWFVFFFPTIILLPFIFLPLLQLGSCHGILCYMNGADEHSYLSYDVARSLSSLIRPTAIVICWLHQLGISGGWINFLADIFCWYVFVGCSACILMRCHFTRTHAWLGGTLLGLLPCLFTTEFNPLLARWTHKVLAGQLLHWVAVPLFGYNPLFRTPEPQVSWVLIALNVVVALRYRSFWLAYLCLPFLYSFVQPGYLFCVLSLQLLQSSASGIMHRILKLGLAYVITTAYITLGMQFVPELVVNTFLIQSHLPVISTVGIITLILYGLCYRFIDEPLRLLALILAIAPMAAQNFHLLNGYLSVPHNVEFSFAVLCPSIILLLTFRSLFQWMWIRWSVVAGALLASLFFGYQMNRHQQQWLPPGYLTDELLQALRTDSRSVVIDNLVAADLVTQCYPMQSATPLGVQPSGYLMADDHINEYRHLRRIIRNNPTLAEAFAPIITNMDFLYKYSHSKNQLLTLGRKTSFLEFYDMTENIPPEGTPPRFRFFLRGKEYNPHQ